MDSYGEVEYYTEEGRITTVEPVDDNYEGSKFYLADDVDMYLQTKFKEFMDGVREQYL